MQLGRRLWITGATLAAALLVSACGGGGGGSSSGGDVYPGDKNIVPTSGPDSFLLFPNPQKQDDGTLQVDSTAYATAYYQAIDPLNERDTLAAFKAKNGFGTSGAGITEETIIVGDQRDLGYGRKMTARQDTNTGAITFMVENYLVGTYGPYSPFNLEAAINAEAKWHLGTNAIEFTPGPAGGTPFVKFYTYDPSTGARLLKANLDGRGDKAMPTICISCHGGRGDPLTPTGLFPKLVNSVSGARGDIAGKLHPFEPASFDFSTVPAYTRAALEAKIKTINKMVLCSYPIPAATAFAEDACRRVTTNLNEYQGTAATHLKDMYGGDALPNATSNTTDTYVPSGWASVGQSTLYLNTQAQACRACHILRGTGTQSDIDFETFAKFDGYSDRIKAHVIDRGNMPLVKLIYDKYWSTPSINGPMATYLLGAGYTDGASKPGRPIAAPVPDRVIKQFSTTLSAANSLFSDSYQWSITSGPAGASLSSTSAVQTTFTALSNGTYVLQLVTSRAGTSSTPASLKIVVDSGLSYDPTALRFADIKTILQTSGCIACHVSPAGGSGVIPPIFYDDYVRSGSGTGADATNTHWFYTELRGRINFTDIVASPLLRKPSGHHHNGGLVGGAGGGFNDSVPLGPPGAPAASRAEYDKILGWILNGAPE